MSNEKKMFMARKADIEYVQDATLVDSKVISRKSDGAQFQVGIFADPDGVKASIVFPNGWEPLGFDIYFGDKYDVGWVDGDQMDADGKPKQLFVCRPSEWRKE